MKKMYFIHESISHKVKEEKIVATKMTTNKLFENEISSAFSI